MQSIILGIIASILSSLTALTVSYTGHHNIHPLWLLLAQYIVGIIISRPKKLPSKLIQLHLIRLVAGLWAFGGYYVALSNYSINPTEASMLINVAPVFAIFIATPNVVTRLGSLLSFCGVIILIIGGLGKVSIVTGHFLALSAAIAYSASIIILGQLSKYGETPSTTNSFYNLVAALVILFIILLLRPPLPQIFWPVFLIGIIAAIRIQILTVAAVNPLESARVSVLSNLAFVWLAIIDQICGVSQGSLRWTALVLVIGGITVANISLLKIKKPATLNSI